MHLSFGQILPSVFPSHKQHVRLPVSPQPHHQTTFVKYLHFCQSDRWKGVVLCSFNSHLSCYECREASLHLILGFPGGTSGREPACQCRRCKRHRFDPFVGRICWRRTWQPTPIFLLGEPHVFSKEEPGGPQSIGLQSQAGLKWLSMHAGIIRKVSKPL